MNTVAGPSVPLVSCVNAIRPFVRCAANSIGSASAANKVIAVMHVDVLDFMLHLLESWEPRPVQSNH